MSVEHVSNNDSNCYWYVCSGTKRLGEDSGKVRNWRTNGDHPNYDIDKSDKNTKKNPEDLRRLAITQIPVKDHQLTLV